MAASNLLNLSRMDVPSPPELLDELTESDDDTIVDDYTQDYIPHQRPASPEPEHIHYESTPTSLQTNDILNFIESSHAPTRAANRPSIPPLKLSRPRTYAVYDNMMHLPTTLHHKRSSPYVPNPSITVLLALTPKPASLAETTAFESFASRFCADFSTPDDKWSCVSLYSHYRAWAAQYPERKDWGGEVDASGVSIGWLHPYALRARLGQETEVPWRLGVPIIQELIAKEVEKGVRSIVVCGLQLGNVESVAAFGQRVSGLFPRFTSAPAVGLTLNQVAEPAGILAFLPQAPLQPGTQLLPAEYKDMTLVVSVLVSLP